MSRLGIAHELHYESQAHPGRPHWLRVRMVAAANSLERGDLDDARDLLRVALRAYDRDWLATIVARLDDEGRP